MRSQNTRQLCLDEAERQGPSSTGPKAKKGAGLASTSPPRIVASRDDLHLFGTDDNQRAVWLVSLWKEILRYGQVFIPLLWIVGTVCYLRA